MQCVCVCETLVCASLCFSGCLTYTEGGESIKAVSLWLSGCVREEGAKLHVATCASSELAFW